MPSSKSTLFFVFVLLCAIGAILLACATYIMWIVAIFASQELLYATQHECTVTDVCLLCKRHSHFKEMQCMRLEKAYSVGSMLRYCCPVEVPDVNTDTPAMLCQRFPQEYPLQGRPWFPCVYLVKPLTPIFQILNVVLTVLS